MPTMKAKLARVRNGLSVRQTIRVSEVINLVDELQMLLQGQDLKSGQGQQNVRGTHSLHTASRAKSTKTEAELLKADQKQHAFRYVGSVLSAGQPFTFLYRGSTKRQCCKDFQMLLGDVYDMTRFPVRGGRQVIAGILANMLGHAVSLTDLEKWFPKPTSQKTEVHEELIGLLCSRGLTWPPNVEGFGQCMSSCSSSYKRSRLSSSDVYGGGVNFAIQFSNVDDFSTSESEAEDLALCAEQFFPEEAASSGGQSACSPEAECSGGSSSAGGLGSAGSSEWCSQAFGPLSPGSQCTHCDAEQELEAFYSCSW